MCASPSDSVPRTPCPGDAPLAIHHGFGSQVRIPVGDWMFTPYTPYIGCTDGALDELDRGLALCSKYGLKALLDIHAMKATDLCFESTMRQERGGPRGRDHSAGRVQL